jgi:hypothetical protein
MPTTVDVIAIPKFRTISSAARAAEKCISAAPKLVSVNKNPI